MKAAFKISLGTVLVILGLIGGMVPVMQGWVFMIPGLIILAEYFRPARRILQWVSRKFGAHLPDKIRVKLDDYLQKFEPSERMESRS